MNWEIWIPRLLKEFWLTLYMVSVSTVLTILLGLPLGVWLNLTSPKGFPLSPLFTNR